MLRRKLFVVISCYGEIMLLRIRNRYCCRLKILLTGDSLRCGLYFCHTLSINLFIYPTLLVFTKYIQVKRQLPSFSDSRDHKMVYQNHLEIKNNSHSTNRNLTSLFFIASAIINWVFKIQNSIIPTWHKTRTKSSLCSHYSFNSNRTLCTSSTLIVSYGTWKTNETTFTRRSYNYHVTKFTYTAQVTMWNAGGIFVLSYISSHPQTVWLHHNFSLRLDTRHDRSWNGNLVTLRQPNILPHSH